MARRKVRLLTLAAIVAVGACLAYLLFWSPYHVFIIHTGSMDPTIPSKSVVVVDQGQYHIGQVVSFRVNGELVTHRLIGIRSDGTITTKGDANTTADPWHPSVNSIIGGVVAAPKQVGWWIYYFRQPTGAIATLLFGICIGLLLNPDALSSPKSEEVVQT